MTKAVKRSYSSAKRDEQARATRRAILDAAHALFVADGYGATTIQAIADTAGVAVQTVYAVFGTKRQLLREVVDLAIAGDDLPVPVNARAESRAIAVEPDARRRAEMDAAIAAAIAQRVAPVVRVMREAASGDPEVAEMYDALTATIRRDMLAAARILAGPEGKLRVAPREAAATLYVLYSPDVFTFLTGDYGWSLARYERWLADALHRLLLDAE